jgi:hypothetical protein
MELLTLAVHLSYILIAVGMWKLGKADPEGFLYQAGGAFVLLVTGFFMNDAGSAFIIWNTIFCLIGLSGYRRLRD